MEDRYLFKAKRLDNGEWVIGGLVRYGFTGREKYYIVPSYASDLYALEIDPSTICWCTGLKDKNGNLIWENAYNRNLGKEKARSYERAIEIVKGGGVDAN